MAINPSQTKPVFQTADVPAGVTDTPASDIPKKTRKKEENQMADVTECPSNSSSEVLTSIPYTNTIESTSEEK